MAELIHQEPSYGEESLEKQTEELAYFEGHDADKPTDHLKRLPTTAGLKSITGGKVVEKSEALKDEASKRSSSELGIAHPDPETGAIEHDGSVDNEAKEPLDPNIVDWNVDDPNKAVNWSNKMKWGNIAVLSVITFITYGSLSHLTHTLQLLI